MKILNWILQLVLIVIIGMPILGSFGIFPPPTPDLYNTPEAFAFIDALMKTGYLTHIMSAVFAICIVLILTKRMALAALLLLPITVNIVAFHLFLDGGLHMMGAIMADVLLVLNVYFLWRNRSQYRALLQKNA